MPLNFTGTDYARYTADPTIAFAPSSGVTVLAVLKRSANSVGSLLFAVSGQEIGGGARFGFGFDGSDKLHTLTSTLVSANTLTGTTSDGWMCVAVTKATGSSTPRFHKHVYSTGVSTHDNGTTTQPDTSAIGALGTVVIANLRDGVTANVPGAYAAVAIYPRILSDSEFESAAASLGAMKGLNPSWGLWQFDGAITGADELFTGSALSFGSPSSVDGGGSPLSYGHPVLLPITESAGAAAAATFTGTGYLTAAAVGSGPPIPDPPVGPGPGSGFRFQLVTPAQVSQDIHFTTTGNFTHDQNRSVRRAISGFRLLPSEAAKVDMAQDAIHAFLDVNGESFPMGVFYFTESSRVKDAIIDDAGTPADIIDVALSDRFIRLMRSDEVPRQALAGADPSQEMISYLMEADVPHSVTGAASNIFDDVVWSPFTTYEEIVSQLADLAGHRRPWADNYGVIRSISSQVVDTEILEVGAGLDIQPIAGTIVVTENYLSAPNRVVVYDDQAAYPVVGTWDAPSSAPNSFLNRGWVLTSGVPQQGLSGPIHAQQVARTIGEQLSARSFSCQILPTNRLDGPVIVRYDGALWLTESWSVSSAPGALMSAAFRELVIPLGEQA